VLHYPFRTTGERVGSKRNTEAWLPCLGREYFDCRPGRKLLGDVKGLHKGDFVRPKSTIQGENRGWGRTFREMLFSLGARGEITEKRAYQETPRKSLRQDHRSIGDYDLRLREGGKNTKFSGESTPSRKNYRSSRQGSDWESPSWRPARRRIKGILRRDAPLKSSSPGRTVALGTREKGEYTLCKRDVQDQGMNRPISEKESGLERDQQRIYDNSARGYHID